MRNYRFGLVLDEREYQALQSLVDRERTTAASVIRKLIWHAAELTPVQLLYAVSQYDKPTSQGATRANE